MARTNKQKFIRKRRLKLVAIVLISCQLTLIAFRAFQDMNKTRIDIEFLQVVALFWILGFFSFIMHFLQFKSMTKLTNDFSEELLDNELVEEKRFVMKKLPWYIRLCNLIYGIINLLLSVTFIYQVLSSDNPITAESVIISLLLIFLFSFIASYVVINSISAYLYHDYPPEIISDSTDDTQ